ncbi:YkvA family protein [Vreelandella olivaria]|uniref:YkvA family protein n=1 Tax=Vreelandella olivaria TaxID=390919 RepID=UPI00201F2B01|nr:YkvA family protein [Halomonas olivaria]
MARLPTWWLLRRLKARVWAIKRIGRALRLFLPMTRDVIRGDFRPVPWSAFGMMALALAYLVMPFDLIPDFLMIIGLVDDVIIIGWLLNRIDQRLEDYRVWKSEDIGPAASQHSPS